MCVSLKKVPETHLSTLFLVYNMIKIVKDRGHPPRASWPKTYQGHKFHKLKKKIKVHGFASKPTTPYCNYITNVLGYF